MIDIPATKSSPQVGFRQEEGVLTVSGECYPENSFAFFDPIFNWLHTELPNMENLHLQVKIPYMNSSSTKCMLDLLDLLADFPRHGCSARVTWYYDKDNDRAFELAEEFSDDVEVPFEIVPLATGESAT